MANVRHVGSHNQPSFRNFKESINSRYGPGTNVLIRKLESQLIKLARESNHIHFLVNCRDNNIVPKGLRIKCPFESIKSKNILNKAGLQLVRERIKYHRHKKFLLTEKIQTESNNLKTLLNKEFENINKSLNTSYTKENIRQKNKLTKKFDRLCSSKGKPNKVLLDKPSNSNDAPAKTVINLSSRNISSAEASLLGKGLNFAVKPKNSNNLDFIAGIESATHLLTTEQSEEFRCKVRMALKRNNASAKPNLSKEELKSLQVLKKDTNIKILPADKGNATVLIDTTVYNKKINDLLNAGKYKILKKDPTKTYENKVGAALKTLKGTLSDAQISRLTPRNSKAPHFYGLPKIHKNNVPLRPIVSSRESPVREISRFLLDIISPIARKSASFVKNAEHFVSIMNNFEIGTSDKLVSFDVESLFTNIPVKETLRIIKNRLQQDKDLKTRTKLNIDTVMSLLDLVTQFNYFELEGQFYSQEDGMAMGSSLSPIFADIFMEDFEERALLSAPHKPRLWLRYVDDTFVIWPHDESKLDSWLESLNNISPSIRLTMEKEVNNKLPFLDVCVERTGNTLNTSVYRKSTHTGQYLNFKSNHPKHVKIGIAKCLFSRAEKICSTHDAKSIEFERINNDLRASGFPEPLIKKAIKDFQNKSDKLNGNADKPPVATIVIPYVPSTSEKIRRIARQYNIRTAFKTNNTLRSHLTKTKPKRDYQETKDCIYSIRCQCDREYIGESKRPLRVRLEEHKRNVKLGYTDKSRIADHVWAEDHKMSWDEAKILNREPNQFKRKYKEASYMSMSKNHISQPSLDIKPLWLPLIREELNNTIPAVLKTNQLQISQNRRITRSMSQKNRVNT